VDVESEPEAQANVDKAVAELKVLGIDPMNAFTRVGDPIEEIKSAGKDYSIIAVGSTGKSGLKRFFIGSVAFKVLEYSKKTVIVVR
jgi:nucleotide-binding universal stress UspA family protein